MLLRKKLVSGGRCQNNLRTLSPEQEEEDLQEKQIPLARVGTPEEVANCVVWLCSDEASYVAGANVRVAGGRPPGTTLG